jgi:hypothetical protein
MDRSELREVGHDLYRNAMRIAEQVSDQVVSRGRNALDRGSSALQRIRESGPPPVDEVRAIVKFGVGAVALVGVGYLIRRVALDRLAQRERRRSQDRSRGRRSRGRVEPTYELLARLDSPDAIQRHNDEVLRQHEIARPARERVQDASLGSSAG